MKKSICFLLLGILFTVLSLFVVGDQFKYEGKFFIEDSVYVSYDGTFSNNPESNSRYEFKGNSINVLLESEFDSSIDRQQYLQAQIQYSQEEIDEIISLVRLNAVNYYSSLRNDFNDKYNALDEEEIQIASPYIELFTQKNITRMSDLDEKYKQMIFDSNVEYLSVYDVFIETTYIFADCVIYSGGCGGGTPSYYTPTPEDSEPGYDFLGVLDAINASGVVNTYTAEGVKVGIWEALEPESQSGRINSSHAQLTNRTIVRRYTSSSPIASLHATQVAIVAAGNDGVAQDSIIYSADFNIEHESLIDLPTLQWFANNNVSVVNMSFGVA